jgi:hypothetical protein
MAACWEGNGRLSTRITPVYTQYFPRILPYFPWPYQNNVKNAVVQITRLGNEQFSYNM